MAYEPYGMVPVGSYVAWDKNFPNTPPLAAGWAESNGQTLSDSGSIYDKSILRNLNGSGGGTQRFIRGSTTSGTSGGADTFTPAGSIGTPSATTSVTSGAQSVATATHTHTFIGTNAASLPSFTTMVWIQRVK